MRQGVVDGLCGGCTVGTISRCDRWSLAYRHGEDAIWVGPLCQVYSGIVLIACGQIAGPGIGSKTTPDHLSDFQFVSRPLQPRFRGQRPHVVCVHERTVRDGHSKVEY